MWFFAALFILSFLVTAFLSPKPKVENARASSLSDFRFPRSNEGDPVPRIYGTVKTTGVNTIGQCNFKAVPIKKKIKTGLFSSKKQIVGYKYYLGLDLAVALGPGVVFRRIWYGKDEIWNGCLYGAACVNVVNVNLPNLLGGADQNGGIAGDIALYCGNFDQARDPYLAANIDAEVPAYNGVAHMVFRDFYWGNSPNIDTISAELAYFSNSLGIGSNKHIMPNGLDANPVEVLFDLYTNSFGNFGEDPAKIDVAQWRTVALTVYDEANGMSVEIANSNTGQDLTTEILRQINATTFSDPVTGLIQLKLIRQDYVIGALPVFGPSEIASLSNFTKKLWGETFNRVRVKYTDRANQYSDAVAIQDDFANIRFQGKVRATNVSMPCCYEADNANRIAAVQLAQFNVPLYSADSKANRKLLTLRPGDPFVLAWPEYNITQMVMRVRKMALGTREDGQITLNMVQDEFATDDTVIGAPTPSLFSGGDYSAHDITAYKVFELPYWLDRAAGFGTPAGFTRVAAFAKAPGTASLDFFGMIDNGADDIEALSNAPYSASATLIAAMDQFAGFTTGVVANVGIQALTEPSILSNGSAGTIASDGHGLFMLNGEILAYETFVDHGDGTYTLTNVHRAMLDTGWVGGALGDTLFFFDGQEGFFDADMAVAATTVYLLDRTVTGRSAEATAPHVALAPVARLTLPEPPDMPTVDGARALGGFKDAGSVVTVAWIERNRTSASIALETDATTAPEAGTLYKVELVQGVTVLVSDDAIAGATHNLTIPAGSVGPAIINVYAKKDGAYSFAPTSYPIYIVPANALEVDGLPVFFDGGTQTAEF